MSATKDQATIKQAKSSAMTNVFRRFPLAMQEVAKVSDLGNRKYNVGQGDLTYLDTGSSDDYTNALGRHLLAEVTEGPRNAEDGDLLHAAQVAWNALARLEVQLTDDKDIPLNDGEPLNIDVAPWPKAKRLERAIAHPHDATGKDDPQPDNTYEWKYRIVFTGTPGAVYDVERNEWLMPPGTDMSTMPSRYRNYPA